MNRHLPAQSILVALLAVSLASGGVGYAVAKLPANSVVSSTIKNGAVKTLDLRDGSVTSAKVQDGSITGADLQDAGVTSADVKDNSLTGADIDESTLTVPAKPGTLVLTGRDFVPRESTTTYSTMTGGDLFLETGADFVPAMLDLPPGATVTGVQVYVIDVGGNWAEAGLVRYNADGTALTEYTFVQSVGTSPDVQTLTLTDVVSVTGNQKLAIIVSLPVSSSYRLIGATVSYTP